MLQGFGGKKLASKIGERTATKAARIAIQQKQTTLDSEDGSSETPEAVVVLMAKMLRLETLSLRF